MSRITEADEELAYATRIVKVILLTVGGWPVPSTSSFYSKLVQRMKNVVTYFLYFVTIAPAFAFAFRFNVGTLKVNSLGAPVNCVVQLCKYTILLFRMKDIQNGLDAIRENLMDVTDEGRMIFHEKAKMGRRIVIIAAMLMYGSGLFFRALLPQLLGPIHFPNNVTLRRLPCLSDVIFFDEQITPYFEIVYTLQVLSGLASYASLSGSCGICALLVLHTCAMQIILKQKLLELVDKTNTNEAIVKQKMKDVVEYQVKVKRFLNNTQKVTEYICLTELLGGTCVLCFVGYSFVLELDNRKAVPALTNFVLEISFLFCIFILCYIGQLLSDESNNVSWTACTLNWYRLPNKYSRCLVLIIAMCNDPMKLTAGRVSDMSLATFTDIMKVSMGYLNMLHEMV